MDRRVANLGQESQIASKLDISSQGARQIVKVSGDVDVATAPKLHERLMRAFQLSPDEVLVDLSDITFIDSTGLGVLVNARQRARHVGAKLLLILPEGQARFPFEVTGLLGVFEYSDTPA